MLQKNSLVTSYEPSESDESGSVADAAMDVVRSSRWDSSTAMDPNSRRQQLYFSP